ncbi:MAG: epoxyqueuosine reductase QueH [Bacillota bacterium]|nr:epoxyqueuosine reductase QueH [Bacillota bacterium]
MKILMHVCCGPCALYPFQVLSSQGHTVAGFFTNPNIHPYQEYLKRREAAQEMARQLQFPLFFEAGYRPEVYFREVAFRETERCRFCYLLRLREVARRAKEEGFEAFTTSLLVSPWQKHELVRDIGEEIAREVQVPFLYFDWRPGYREGRRRARVMGLYSQKYCGCLFSERERYAEVKKGG